MLSLKRLLIQNCTYSSFHTILFSVVISGTTCIVLPDLKLDHVGNNAAAFWASLLQNMLGSTQQKNYLHVLTNLRVLTVNTDKASCEDLKCPSPLCPQTHTLPDLHSKASKRGYTPFPEHLTLVQARFVWTTGESWLTPMHRISNGS